MKDNPGINPWIYDSIQKRRDIEAYHKEKARLDSESLWNCKNMQYLKSHLVKVL
jgi:hypothetical protein